MRIFKIILSLILISLFSNIPIVLSDIEDDMMDESFDLENIFSELPENFDIDTAEKADFERLPFFSRTDAEKIIEFRKNYHDGSFRKNIDKISWLTVIQRDILHYLIEEKKKKRKTDVFSLRSGISNKPNKESFKESKYYLKTKYVRNNMSFSFLCERDSKEPKSFDFVSGNILAVYNGGRTKIVLGDFRPQTGQGLAVSKYQGFFGYSSMTDMWKDMSLENYSFEESGFFRGIYFSHRLNKIKISVYGSDRTLKALEDNGNVYSIDTSGYNYSGDSENTLNEKSFSGGIETSPVKNLNLGISGLIVRYYPRIIPKIGEKYYSYPSGKRFDYLIFDGRYSLEPVNIFFENVSMNNSENAFCAGIEYSYNKFKTGILARKYSEKYWSLRSGGISLFGDTGNEQGIFAGFQLLLPGKIKISSMMDIGRTITRTYDNNMPSTREKVSLSVTKTINTDNSIGVSFRETNDDTEGAERKSYKIEMGKSTENNKKNTVIISMAWSESMKKGGPFGEVKIYSVKRFIKMSLFAFDIPSYNSRYYHYEFDVPGFGFSSGVWGKGAGFVSMMSYKGYSARYSFSDSDLMKKNKRFTLQYDNLF